MPTGYHIQIGYNSATPRNDVVQRLLAVVDEICKTPELIIREVWRVENVNVPAEYADNYRKPWNDLTVKILDDNGQPEIMQMASGGGIERDYKECMRRAFCRLVIQEMHRTKHEVNLVVA